jgi:phosphatidylinositol-3-phosphatase
MWHAARPRRPVLRRVRQRADARCRRGNMIARLAAALTARRMIALAILSTLATTAVVAAATRRRDDGADVVALAALRRAPVAVAAAPAPAAVASTTPPSTGAPTPTPAPATAGPKGSPRASRPATTSAPPTGVAGPTTTSGGAPPKPKPARIKHVFVIALDGPGNEAFAPASAARYLSAQLRPQGTLLSGYTTLGGGELADEIALISGQAPNPATSAGCTTYSDFPNGAKPDANGLIAGSGCVYPIIALTLPDQLTSAGLTWRAYVEGMGAVAGAPATCRHPGPGAPDPTAAPGRTDEYATRHNPFVYFHSLLDLGDCSANDIALDHLGSDLTAIRTTPNLAFIAPNLCDGGGEQPCLDGTPGGLGAADAFLNQWVPRITQSPAYRADGLLVIAFAGGGAQARTSALLLSRYARPGSASTADYTPYSLLRSIEDIFAVEHLGGAAAAGVRSLLGDALAGARAR